MAKKKEPLSPVHCRQCSYATDFIENSCFCKIRSHRSVRLWQIRQDMREIQEKMIMDIEIEKKIEQLEWQRDNAMRIRCPLVARKYQRMIDELAKESRNKNMNKAEQARQ